MVGRFRDCGFDMCIEPLGADLDSLATIVSTSHSAGEAWEGELQYFRGRGWDPVEMAGSVTIDQAVYLVRQQLLRVFEVNPMPKNLGFLYFGLFDRDQEVEEMPSAGFYVSGGIHFDDKDADSLCDLPYAPDDGEITSELLDQLKRGALSDQSSREFIEYAVMFGLGSLLAKFGLPEQAFGLKVIVGFDEGDFAEIALEKGSRRI